MLRPRIIPCLLVSANGLIKTKQFQEPKYVGDPLNTVRIFNEKGVDELFIIDIDATTQSRQPNYELIAKIATESTMPLCVGGGISSPDQAFKIIDLGVEKIAISTAAVEDPKLVSQLSSSIGTQSVTVVLDTKKTSPGVYSIYTRNGKIKSPSDVITTAKQMQDNGAGELVINSIDRDGTMEGYDIDLALQLRDIITIPITLLGGAGSLEDMQKAVEKLGTIGTAAGSLFIFKGKYRAVLINYPSREEKQCIFRQF